jgi:hypothetical protein
MIVGHEEQMDYFKPEYKIHEYDKKFCEFCGGQIIRASKYYSLVSMDSNSDLIFIECCVCCKDKGFLSKWARIP